MSLVLCWTALLVWCLAHIGREHLRAEATIPVTLTTLPSSPIATSSGVVASLQCTKNSDEIYAICASASNTAIKYNLQPFSFAAKGPDQGDYMYSCDLYETSSQSTSRAVCGRSSGTVDFHSISDMTVIVGVSAASGFALQVIVDASKRIAYASNRNSAVCKITNIDTANPVVAATLSTFGPGDMIPSAMIIIGGFLYVHFVMDNDLNPTLAARLARINITTFAWNRTVTFADGEYYGALDNLANDDNFIYDLTIGGILVRCTYKNNNFARFGSLNTGYSNTYSLMFSRTLGAVIVVSNSNSLLQMVDTASFSKIGNSVTVPSAQGRPIVTKTCNIYAFSAGSDKVYAFKKWPCHTASATVSSAKTLTNSGSIQRTRTNTDSASSSSTRSATISSKVSLSMSVSPAETASIISPSSSTSSPLSDTSEISETVSIKKMKQRTGSRTAMDTRSGSADRSRSKSASNKIQDSPNSGSFSSSTSPTSFDSVTKSHTNRRTAKIITKTLQLKNPPLPPAKDTKTATLSKTIDKTKSQTLGFASLPVIAVVAPEAASATASIAAAAGGLLSGDAASPTQAARALSLAAIATACANDVVYVPAPPPDENLPWPQGSLFPQIQISLANDDPKDSWRKHFRGAILANFVVFPLIILCIVVPIIYGLQFTRLRHSVSAKYVFAMKKSREREEREPDLVADSRLFGVILFLFGLGLESATCAFVTLLASPRATNDSLGFDIFVCLVAIVIIIAGLGLLLKVELGANEKLECVPSEITFKHSETRNISENQVKAARFLFGSLCWTYRGSLDSEEKIEDGKMYFLRNRNLFASNQGAHEEISQNNNSITDENNCYTVATEANVKINEGPDSFARKISVFASMVDCSLTVIAGLIRGLTVSGALSCDAAIILLVISQILPLMWAVLVRSSLYPITKILNIVMCLLLFGAALGTLTKSKEASTFAVSVAMILSFLGMMVGIARLLARRVFKIIVYPKREKIVAEMNQEVQNYQAFSLASPFLAYYNSSGGAAATSTNNSFVLINNNDNDLTDEELLGTPPHAGSGDVEVDMLVTEEEISMANL